MNLDIIHINQLKMKVNHQNDESECSDPDVINAQKNGNFYPWKALGRYKDEFSPHQAVVINQDTNNIHILGSNGNKNSNLMYDMKTIKVL